MPPLPPTSSIEAKENTTPTLTANRYACLADTGLTGGSEELQGGPPSPGISEVPYSAAERTTEVLQDDEIGGLIELSLFVYVRALLFLLFLDTIQLFIDFKNRHLMPFMQK